MTRAPSRCLQRSIAAAALAALPLAAAAADRDRGIPQLTPAIPGAFVGTCEALAAQISLPGTTVTGTTTVPAASVSVLSAA